jgi:hypothetical protein
MDIAIVTDVEHLNGTENDRLLAPALEARGLSVRLVAWDDEAMDWSLPRLSVIRATWDYHLRREAFMAWAERVSGLTSLWNPITILRWNTHKGYLRELAERGVRVVPTIWLARREVVDLAEIFARQGWSAAVVKPAVSASAYATKLVTRERLAAGQAHLDDLLASRDMMVQPYLASVLTTRERSLVYVDGRLTHTFLRAPALVHGTTEAWNRNTLTPNDPEEDAFAAIALSCLEERPLYARVDLVRDDAGQLCLMELELVEPSLGLDLAPRAATDILADAIAARL